MRKSLALTFTAAALSVASVAYSQNTASIKDRISAGILYMDGQTRSGYPYVQTPHVWANLDRNKDVKPVSWDLTNPRSEASMTNALSAQWTALGGPVPAIGSRLSKKSAAYWAVSLSRTTIDQLADYDVLLMPINSRLSLGPIEREKLRRFVDQGGVLWMAYEPVGAVTFDLANPSLAPIVGTIFSGNLLTDAAHPLINTPNTLSQFDLARLAENAPGFRPVTVGDLGGIEIFNRWQAGVGTQIRPIVGSSATNQLVGVMERGEGYVVVTSCNVAEFLNRSSNIANNRSFEAGAPADDIYSSAAAKLAVNIINLRSGFRSTAAGARNNLSNGMTVGAPPIERYNTSGLPTENAVIAKGRVVMIKNGELVVLDANPGNDLDNDGNPDDGVADVRNATWGGTDVIWSVNVGGTTSGVTVAEAVGSANPDRILYVNSGGQVVSWPLFQANPSAPNGSITSAVPPNFQASTPYTPVVHDGLVYVTGRTTAVQANGQIYAVNLADLTPPQTTSKASFSIENAFRLSEPSGPPTVGYVPIADNSGGVDLVAYVPTRSNAATRRPTGLVSVWAGTKGEKPSSMVGGISTPLRINTRASDQGVRIVDAAGALGVKVTFIDMVTGLPFPQGNMASIVTGIAVNGNPGTIDVSLNFGQQTPSGQPIVFDTVGNVNAPNTTVRVDYTIDWSTAVNTAIQPENFIRGDVQFPDNSSLTKEIKGRIAMGGNGNIFVVIGGNSARPEGGSLYCLREQGRGDFRVLYRWELHDSFGPGGQRQLNVPLSGSSTPLVYDASVVDYDGLLNFPVIGAILDQPLRRMRFESGPVVRGNTVYVTAAAFKSFPTPDPLFSVLMAFNANPGQPSITLSGTNSASWQITQPDLTRTENTATNALMVALQPGQFSSEKIDDTGNVKITLDNMSATTRGPLVNTIANNLPIYVRTSGGADLRVEPEATGPDGQYVPGYANGSWNPLRWYSVYNGLYIKSNMVATGGTLYFGGASILPNLITTGSPFGPTRGLMYAHDLAVAPSDLRSPDGSKAAHLPGASIRPWNRVLSTLEVTGPNDIRQSNYIRWPQITGVASFQQFPIRLFQAVLRRGDTTVTSIAAGDNTVVVGGSNLSYGFTRGDFLIADEGRIIRLDAAGNPLWARETTRTTGPEIDDITLSKSTKLSRPWRVYGSGNSSYWVVDAGADRIMRVDASGREERVINGFRVHPGFRPRGLADNPVTNLRIPKDVAVWTSVKTAANNPFPDRQPNEFWRHYLIADQGNSRIIELVDRYNYDPATNGVGSLLRYISTTGSSEPCLGLAFGHSAPELSTKQYAYNSIARLVSQDGLRVLYAFGFGNVEPGKNTFGITTGGAPATDVRAGGGVVVFDPQANTEQVITSYNVPAFNAELFDFTTGAWVPTNRPAQTRKIAGLQSVTFSSDINGNTTVMITDANGVWEMDLTGNVIWCLPSNVYRSIRRSGAGLPNGDNPLAFVPTYAKRLDNGDVLLANAYQGSYLNTSRDIAFGGEVIMLDGAFATGGRGFDWAVRNFGFDRESIRLSLPPLQGARGLSVPVFVDRR